MIDENAQDKNLITQKETVCFGFGAFTDQMSHQAFQMLVFTYYYAIVTVPSTVLAAGFIIFAIWDSINDPLIGPISDRTRTKYGRRAFWILVALIPFGLIHIFLFTPPDTGNQTIQIIYMIVIIMVYDLIYTIFSVNQLTLFPEMFKNIDQRSKANMYKNILTIIGVILGAVLPTLIITPLTPTGDTAPEVIEQIPGMYITTGVILCCLVIVFGLLFYKFGIKEDSCELTKPEEMPSLKESLKLTLKNKAFIIFVTANLFNWFVYKLLITIVPLYGVNVLGIDAENESFQLTLLLLIALLSAALCFPLMKKLGLKVGMRKGFMITETIWIVALIPFWFLDNQPYIAMICMAFMGIGLSGAMYFVDIIIASIIDEDEVKNGKRREGAFYGINALINRYSTILVFVVIAAVLTGYGWDQYLVQGETLSEASLVLGLKVLMVIFNILGILVVILCLKFFPLHGKRLEEVKNKIREKRKQ